MLWEAAAGGVRCLKFGATRSKSFADLPVAAVMATTAVTGSARLTRSMEVVPGHLMSVVAVQLPQAARLLAPLVESLAILAADERQTTGVKPPQVSDGVLQVLAAAAADRSLDARAGRRRGAARRHAAAPRNDGAPRHAADLPGGATRRDGAPHQDEAG